MKLTISSLLLMVAFARAIAAFPAKLFEDPGAGLLDPNSELDDGSTHSSPSGTDPSPTAPEVPTFTPPVSTVEPSDSTPTSDSVPTTSLSSETSTPSSDTQSSSSSEFQSSITTIISSTSPSTTDAPTSSASSSAEQPSTTPKAPSTTDSQPSSTSPSSTSFQPTSTPVAPPVVDKQAYLDAHNSIRKAFGVEELSWSDDLQAKAQSYAEQCQLKHSDGALGPVGENLAAATGSFTARRAVRLFARDQAAFNARNLELSHFTQIVWKATTQLGCGVASCDDIFPGKDAATYHVCLYDPVGNVVGQEKENLNLD